ncbi:MAG: thioredoxin family protein, partial [Flavobacteriales bacterium]|nr:thioredoxin family protein [Flavobacteriales bacterium]
EGKPKKEYDPNFMMDLYFFEGSAAFRQKISFTGTPSVVNGTVEYMACNDEGCLPPKTVRFSFDPQNLSATVQTGDEANLNNSPVDTSGYKFQYFKASIDKDHPYVADCSIDLSAQEKSGTLWEIFILGFIGGLLALLTPCVFPMIPLTVTFFTKGSNNRRRGIRNAVTFGVFVLLIYLLFSLPFHLLESVHENIFNEISTNVTLNVFFFVTFVVFAISFFGYFEITLPNSIANRADKQSNAGGIIGAFFMALTLAIVSFSCTGPILGSLLASSLSTDGGAMQLSAGMGGFGLALGIPFALFAMFPSWMQALPRSGGWLNSVKVVLAFLEVAAALKFFSNADLVTRWGLLKYEVFMGLWILVSAGIVLYLLGFIRFPHDSKVKKFSIPRVTFAALFTVITFYLCTGFRYNESTGTYHSLSMLSGLAPPVGYSWMYPKDCPHNLNCEHDYEKALARAKAENKPLFIDFTGYACVNCRKVEEHIWIDPKVLSILDKEVIVVSLHVDDRHEVPDSLKETVSSQRRQGTRDIVTWGDRWSVFQIETFVSNSQPYYCMVTPDETLLTKPIGYSPDLTVDKYEQWLRCGIDGFEKYIDEKGK